MTRRRRTSGLRVIPIEPGSVSTDRPVSVSNASHKREELVSRPRDRDVFRANVSVRFSLGMQELGCWSSESGTLNGRLRGRIRYAPARPVVTLPRNRGTRHRAPSLPFSLRLVTECSSCDSCPTWSRVQLGGSGRDTSEPGSHSLAEAPRLWHCRDNGRRNKRELVPWLPAAPSQLKACERLAGALHNVRRVVGSGVAFALGASCVRMQSRRLWTRRSVQRMEKARRVNRKFTVTLTATD
jgi:hypothetical protein